MDQVVSLHLKTLSANSSVRSDERLSRTAGPSSPGLAVGSRQELIYQVYEAVQESPVGEDGKPHLLTQLKLICMKALTAGKNPELAGGGAAGPTRLHDFLFFIYSSCSPYSLLGRASMLHRQKGCRSNTGFPGKIGGGDSYRIPV